MALQEQQKQTAVAARPGIYAMLNNHPTTIERLKLVLPAHITPQKFCRIALTELNTNPNLNCKMDDSTFMFALVQAAELGLRVGKLYGEAFLIPYANKNRTDGLKEVSMMTGYHGLKKLALQSGDVLKIEAEAVYRTDVFEWEKGLDQRLKHAPDPDGTRSDVDITHFYSIAWLANGMKQFEVMSRKQVDAIRDRGRANPIWNSDYGEMGRKTLIRRLCKALPKSPELADALAADDAADAILSLPASHEPKKIAQTMTSIAAADNADRDARMAADEREVIVANFDIAWDECRNRGGNPNEILKVPETFKILATGNDQLEAYIEQLNAWKAPAK